MMRIPAFVLAAALAYAACCSAFAAEPPPRVPAAGIPQPSGPDDLVGLVLQNLGETATPVLPLTFGELFKPGAVMPRAPLLLNVGKRIPVQMDPKTFNPDGSVAIATLTVTVPSLPARTATGAMLMRAPAGAPLPSPPIDLAAALGHYSLIVVLGFDGPDGATSRIEVNGSAALQAALRNATAKYWRRGPEATEALVSVPVHGSLRLVFDISAYANGSFQSDVRFNNDLAMQPIGGTVNYSESIVQDGRTVSRQDKITQYQYQDWHQVVGTIGPTAQVYIQHDIAYLEQTGAIANFDLRLGIPTSLLSREARMMAAPGWEVPLSPRGLTEYMPMTGGRPDIGPTTEGNAAWLLTQNATAAEFALGQADAAGAPPWHFFDAGTEQYLTTEDIPNIWTDPRGGPHSGTVGLTQQVPADTRWRTDSAHQPDLSYVAYLLTGRQFYLDQLNAQAAWCETSFWPAAEARDNGRGLVVQGAQVRGAAWSLREIAEAAYANPSGSRMRRYFRRMEDNNFSWLVSHIPAWTAAEGQAYGYIPGAYGNTGAIAPWEQDFLASTVVLAAEQGDRQAVTFLTWESNFLVGRFLNGANGFNPRDGIAYNLFMYDPRTRKAYTTWAEIERATEAAKDANGDGWKYSNGYYGQLGLATLAGIITVTGSLRAVAAYRWLLGSGAPYTDPVSLATSPQFAIVPRRNGALAEATR